jgi:methyl-accepting chemotaxis protein
MKIKDLKTSTKLGLGFGVLVMFTASVCFIGWLGMNKMNQQNQMLTELGSMRAEYNLSRLFARTFVHVKDISWADKANASMEKILVQLEQMKKEQVTQPEKILIDDIMTNLNQYHDNFKINKSNINQIVDFIIKAKKLDDDMSSLESSSVNNKGIEHFNKARLLATGFIAYSDAKYIDLAKKEIETALSDYTTNNESFVKVLNDYQLMLNQLTAVVISQNDLDSKQPVIGTKITAGFDQLQKLLETDATNAKRTAVSFMIIFTIISLGFGLLIALAITRYFTSSLNNGVQLARAYASGDLTYRLSENEVKGKDEIAELMYALRDMGNKIREVVSNILLNSENVSQASIQINATTQQLSQGATEQASSTEQVSASMQQMFSSIQQNSENSIETEKIANKSAKGIEKVAKASEESLSAVKQITNKISIINDIAFQTNILALNAAVEAARAGEHGKGFAVVAAEVRKLAERSKIAANEIVDLSNVSLNVSGLSVQQLTSIIPEIEKTAHLVQEIAAASREQNTGSEQVNNAIQQLNQVTQQNAAASEEIASSTDELANQAEQLKEIVSFFKV